MRKPKPSPVADKVLSILKSNEYVWACDLRLKVYGQPKTSLMDDSYRKRLRGMLRRLRNQGYKIVSTKVTKQWTIRLIECKKQ